MHTFTHRARREAVTGGRPGSRLDAHEHLKRLRGDEDAAVILEAAHFLSFAYAAFSWPIECYTKGPAAACADMCGAWRSLLLLCKLHPTPKACAHGHPCHSVCVPVRLCACVPVCLCVCVSVCLCVCVLCLCHWIQAHALTHRVHGMWRRPKTAVDSAASPSSPRFCLTACVCGCGCGCFPSLCCEC